MNGLENDYINHRLCEWAIHSHTHTNWCVFMSKASCVSNTVSTSLYINSLTCLHNFFHFMMTKKQSWVELGIHRTLYSLWAWVCVFSHSQSFYCGSRTHFISFNPSIFVNKYFLFNSMPFILNVRGKNIPLETYPHHHVHDHCIWMLCTNVQLLTITGTDGGYSLCRNQKMILKILKIPC